MNINPKHSKTKSLILSLNGKPKPSTAHDETTPKKVQPISKPNINTNKKTTITSSSKKTRPQNTSSLKPSPKVQSNKTDELSSIKNSINQILSETSEQITLLSNELAQFHKENTKERDKLDEDYLNDLDKIYMEWSSQRVELNNKYDIDGYKLKEYYDVNDSYNINNEIYNAVGEDKKQELDSGEEDFLMKKNFLQMTYQNKVKELNESLRKKELQVDSVKFIEDIRIKMEKELVILNGKDEKVERRMKRNKTEVVINGSKIKSELRNESN